MNTKYHNPFYNSRTWTTDKIPFLDLSYIFDNVAKGRGFMIIKLNYVY